MLQKIVEQEKHLPKELALVLWFESVGITDISLVGGKNASLGEMIQQLTPLGINVPTGFGTTAYAYRFFIEKAGLEEKLRSLFANLDVEDVNNLRERGKQARALILHTPFPEELEEAITQAYLKLCKRCGYSASFGNVAVPKELRFRPNYKVCDRYINDTDVAVRSSTIAEYLPDASFAGQQETYLNVRGVKGVLDTCHKCFASLFTDRAISYRTLKGFDHFNVALSVGVQKMVRSDLASSGVMFSIDTETGFKDAILINAAYGLGENVVQGAVNPDEFFVFKPTFKQGFRPILEKLLGSKEIKLVYDVSGSKLTKNMPVTEFERCRYALRDDEILKLAHWACMIEEHYSAVHGHYTPMDIEWAKDGITGQMFIVQARPETVQSQKSVNFLHSYKLQATSKVLTTGRAVGETIGVGKARVILDAHKKDATTSRYAIDEFQSGEVLVTYKTDPDWEPIMKKANGIITNQGGRTCHAAIIARELGIPAIVGTGNAISMLKTGQAVTISCAEGEEGQVYQGLLPYEVKQVALLNLPRTRTQIMMNVSNPQEAFSLAAIPNDGVGLARLEFIIANYIKVHPLALVHYDRLQDEDVKDQIELLTTGYEDKPLYFVDKLAQGVGMIAAAFYPKPVVVRLSDFKSNEYANLLGSRQFESKEENPMIGWRGASRYYDEKYPDGFALECKALRCVREEMGLTNVIPMIPFCRTPDEGRKVLAQMEKHGLKRGENGLMVYILCASANNLMLADQFSLVFDGFLIDSNDLTQPTLGIDRDSALVANIFDKGNEGVKEMVRMAIEKAQKNGCKIGMCGQAPSNYPEEARFLVELGIDSISLKPDSVMKILLEVAIAEGLDIH